jgi:tetratricopeptide (TPR) repeat protein
MLSLLLLLTLPVAPGAPAALTPRPAAVQDARSAEATDLVRRGRALIAEGKGEEARELLARADQADGGRWRTRMWLVRALIEKGFLNDALDMTDQAAEGGASGPGLDYCYGMAFVAKARKYIAQGVNLGTVGMHYSDAVDLLRSATAAEPDEFADAYLPLAEAAWNSQRLEEARDAAEQAVERQPSSAARFQLAEIAFSQFVVANADEALAEEAAAHWTAAFDAFQAVAAEEDREGGDAWRMANALRKSGDALVWQGKLPEAAEQYGRAMGAAPAAVDFGQLLGSLGQEQFRRALEAGSADFVQRYGEKNPADATMVWWLGYARFTDKEFDLSREAYERAYAKWPEAANSLWYVALCHYHTKRMDDAVDALARLATNDEAALTGAVQSNLQMNLRILDYLVGHCFQSGRLVDAGRLSAAQANASPETSRYWNNVGLFYRDAADTMGRGRGKEVDRDLQRAYYETALQGYERALALEPTNAQLLNDTAVVMHYNLDRDLPRARKLYLQSAKEAEAALENPRLPDDEREILQTALRDSRNNLERLDALVAKREEEARKKREKEEAERRAREEAERKKREEEAAGGGR